MSTEKAAPVAPAQDFGWSILELMGHRRLGGRVQEATIAGAGVIRIDVPNEEGGETTQFYAPGALFSLTPTTEAVARAVARTNQPAPVSRFELEAPRRTDPPGGTYELELEERRQDREREQDDDERAEGDGL